MATADQLIDAILTSPENANNGILANDLLREFHRGFPIAALRPLLSHGNENVVRIGAFVTSELGTKATPLLSQMVRLLNYPNKFVRSDAICSVLTCASGSHENEIGTAISLLDDPDWPIRWKTMEFLSLASIEQLKAGLRHFETASPDSSHIDGLKWLASENGRNAEQITSWLASTVSLRRKYAAVAAARIASTTNSLLELASSSDDSDVKQFADSMLRMQARSNTHRE